MALNADSVQQLYVAYLGRAADPDGLEYWTTQVPDSFTLADLRWSLVNAQPEYQELYGDLSREEVISAIYQNMFGREPEAAGLEYWVNGDGASVPMDELQQLFIEAASPEDRQTFEDKVENLTTPTNVFTLTEIPSQTTTTLVLGEDGIPVEMAIEFLQDVAGLDLVALGLLDEDGNLQRDVASIDIEDNTDGSAQIIINAGDDVLDAYYGNGSLALIADVLFEGYLYAEETTTQTGIVLTPGANNGGAFEGGFTTAADDHIIAGRTELLHGAYIDGGPGYNTLEVDMKGFFAQPFQLLNIQEVQVQNLSNVYDVGQTILADAEKNFPVANIDSGNASNLDLSRASDLEKLVVTEGPNNGTLNIAGIQNYATARLEGSFSEAVNLYYGRGQGDLLTVELANVSFDSTFSVNQNVGAVELVSEGRVNTLNDVDFGGNFVELIVSGTGMLSIEDDLQFGFGEAHIDASANTGGVRLNVSSQDDFGALEEITIVGSQVRDIIGLDVDGEGFVADGALLDIDTGAGRDTLKIGSSISPREGSVITGENLTVEVNANADLRKTDVTGVNSFVIAAAGGLLLTQAQVEALGAGAFAAAHNDVPVLSIEVSEEGTALSDLIDLTALDSDVKLAFNVKAGASLELTAEELHTYLAEDGIVGEGTVNLTGAGLGFDVDDTTSSVIGDGVGTIDAGFEGTLNVVRAADGFERPVAAPDSDVLVIDTTDTGGVIVGANDLQGVSDNVEAFSTAAETVIIEGTDDITFNVPVEMLTDGFTLDFSDLTGALNNLTIEQFNNVEEVIGNGAAGVRIDVVLNGDVGVEGENSGLISSGVEQYVVVDINDTEDDDGDSNVDTASFHLCDNTQDLDVIGLQGSAGKTLTYTNIPWGAVNPTVLFEGDGFGNWDELPKAASNPNESNVGTIVAEYFFDGAPANVLITNQGVDPGLTSDDDARPIVVDGIELVNAQSLNVTAEDGNTVISELTGDSSLEDVTLTSAFDVTLNVDSGENTLESIDASGVEGTMTLFVQDDGAVDLSDTTLTGIDAVVMEDDSELTLTIDQIQDIGAGDFSHADFDDNGDEATLNVDDYDGAAFDFSILGGDGILVGSVTTAEGTVVVDPTTDFTGISQLIVPEGSDVTISADQFKQLVDSGATIDTQGSAPTGSLTVDLDGDLTIGADDETTINGSNVTFDMADGETLNIELLSLADGLQVTGDAAAATKPLVNFLFNDTDADLGTTLTFSDTINVEGYQEVDVRILDQLLNLFQVGGTNSQEIEELLVGLANANILNIYQDELVVELDPRDRTVVVEPEASPDGIEFEPGTGADYVRSIDLTLQANGDSAANIGTIGPGNTHSILIDDGDTTNSHEYTLTINTEDVSGADALTADLATIAGDIEAANATSELRDVVINANAVDLDIQQSIVFSSTDPSDTTATLTLTGDADVTIKELEAGAGVSTIDIDTTGYSGTLNVTGGSPALSEVSTTDSEDFITLNLEGDADVTVGTPVADEGDWSYGINAPQLSTVNAALHTGALTMLLGAVDSESFAFTAGSGATTLWLTEIADSTGSSIASPVLSGTGDWAINMAGAGNTLRITDDVDLSNGGDLELDMAGATLEIEGNVDFRDLDELTFIGDAPTIVLLDGATVQMTDDQFAAFEAANGTITGDTVIEVTSALTGDIGTDLTDVRGATELQVDNGLTITVTGEQALLTRVYDAATPAVLGAAGELADATVNVEVAEDIDLTAVSDMNSLTLLDADGDATTSLTVQLSAAEASQLAGNITRNNDDDTIEVTYSGDAINPTGVAPADAASFGDLAAFNLSEVDRLILDGDLTLSQAQLDAVLEKEAAAGFEGEIVKNGNALNVLLQSGLWVAAGFGGDMTVYGDLVDTIDVVNGVFQPLIVTFDQASNTNVWDFNPYIVETAVEGDAGDFSSYSSTVTVDVADSADLTDLQGVTTFDLPADTDAADLNDLSLTARDDQLTKLDVDGDTTSDAAFSASGVLAQLSSLTVAVQVDTGNTDIDSNPIIVESAVNFTYDAGADEWNVTGNAAAIGEAQKASDFSALLNEATSVTWSNVGTTASMVLEDGATADLTAATGDDTFVFGANVDTDVSSSLVITGFGSSGTDTIDLSALTGAASLTEGPTFAMADDSVFFLGGQAAGAADSDADAATAISAATTDDVDMTGSYVVIADDNSSALYQVSNTGADADDIVAGDLTLIGTVDNAALTAADITVA